MLPSSPAARGTPDGLCRVQVAALLCMPNGDCLVGADNGSVYVFPTFNNECSLKIEAHRNFKVKVHQPVPPPQTVLPCTQWYAAAASLRWSEGAGADAGGLP